MRKQFLHFFLVICLLQRPPSSNEQRTAGTVPDVSTCPPQLRRRTPGNPRLSLQSSATDSPQLKLDSFFGVLFPLLRARCGGSGLTSMSGGF